MNREEALEKWLDRGIDDDISDLIDAIFDDFESTCSWRNDDEEYNVYSTECENLFQLVDGTPDDNDMAFCPYCGHKIEVKE